MIRLRRIALAAAVVVAGAGMGAGCKPPAGEEAAGTEPAGAAQELLVGFSQCNNAEPWREAMNKAATDRARDFEQLRLVISDAENDAAKQIADVENFLQQKVDLLIISPKEAAPLTQVVTKVYESGTPVIVLDRDILEPNYTCFIGADNKEIGQSAGEFIVEYVDTKLGGAANVVILQGLMGSTPGQDRQSGCREVIDEHAGIKIVGELEADWLQSKGMDRMKELLTANEKIDIVYAHNDPMAVGAYLAAKEAGRENEMIFIGIDALATPEGGIRKVMDGILTATLWYPTCGEEAIETTVKILNGEPFEERQTLPTALITKENAAEWLEKLGGKTES
jgi:ribose transport system substrate-binding protein